MICRSEYADTSMNSSIEGENSSAHDESLNSSVDSTTEAGKKREPLKPKNRYSGLFEEFTNLKQFNYKVTNSLNSPLHLHPIFANFR